MLRSHRAAALLGSLVAIGGALGCDATDGTAARTAGDRDGATAMAADASARGRDGGGDAMAEGGWAVRELHSVEGHSWEPVPASEYDAHLDYVKRRIDADELWMDTATNVIRYRRAREACAAPRGDGRWLVFEPPSPTCAAYATALTWVVRIDGEPLEALRAEQAGAPVAVRALGSQRFVVDANPAMGSVTLVAP